MQLMINVSVYETVTFENLNVHLNTKAKKRFKVDAWCSATYKVPGNRLAVIDFFILSNF